MRNSGELSRVLKTYRTELQVGAILFFGGLLLACGFGSAVSQSSDLSSQGKFIRCMYQIKGEAQRVVQSYDKAVVATLPATKAGWGEGSLCYRNDAEYAGVVDKLQNGELSEDQVIMGQGPLSLEQGQQIH